MLRSLVLAGITVTLMLSPIAVPAAHADTDYGGGCVLFANDRAATVDSLRFRCNPEQQDAIFRDAPRRRAHGSQERLGGAPRGHAVVDPAVWIGKTFYTGPDGGYLMNRITGAGIEGWPANVYTAPAILDGQPTWALDYAPSPTPQVYDEIREVTPGVWFGYSWWREGGQNSLMLTFALA